MSYEDDRELDASGKVVFDDIYDAEDPCDYYLTLGRYNYLIPESARAVYGGLYPLCLRRRRRSRLRVVDVGCSYGVNAALLRFGLNWSELQARYAGKVAEGVRGETLCADDAAFLAGRKADETLEFVGVDAASRAIGYARRSGLLAEAISINLEEADLSAKDALAIEGADMIISTGAVGYVGAATFERLVDAASARPWVACFVLRQFSYDGVAATLSERGYVTEVLEAALFPQRCFVDAAERDGALERLAQIGREPTALEENGWYAAEFFLSRPEHEVRAQPLSELLARHQYSAAAHI